MVSRSLDERARALRRRVRSAWRTLQALGPDPRRWPAITLATVGLGLVAVLTLTALVTYSTVELARFERAQVRRTTYVYAAGQTLLPGLHVRLADVLGTLARLKYRESRTPPAGPGQFQQTAGAWEIFLRGRDAPAAQPSQRVRLEIRGERIARVTRDGQDVGVAVLEPEIVTSAGDRPGEDYRPLRLADAPPVLIDAVLAIEDHRFFEHGGVDLRGLFRAAWTNLRGGRIRQGGSTLTQQLVKNRLLGAHRTWARKLREAWLATLVELRYPKARLLEAYLNEIYLGQRGPLAIRGASAAARVYFGKEVHQLSLGEAAILAGMIRAPNTYSPALDSRRARERRDVVLARMRELGRIDDRQLAVARAEPVRVTPAPTSGQPAPYFADYVRQELEEHLGSDTVTASRGTRVYTTLDLTLQRFAEAAIARGLDRLETRVPRLRRAEPSARLQAALVAIDPATGHVRAMVGGRDYQASQFNRAVRARRQPGSAFKPFVYLTALAARGGRPAFTAASLVEDTPITLTVGGQPWSPRNYEDRYEGTVTVRKALELSLNAATVRVSEAVGLPAVVETARALGLEGELLPVPAMALGAFEVTPLELSRAYLPFANGGRRLDGPGAIQAVVDGDGDALPLGEDEPSPVMSEAEAYLMTSLLQGVITSGTGASVRALGVPGPLAGKTGTTNDGRDAWFVGYSPTLVALVWIGFDSGESHGLAAAQAALPIWADFMKQAVDAYPAGAFTVPRGIAFVDIDAVNGKAANRFCPVTARETFVTGTEPEPCPEHGGVTDRVFDLFNRFRDWLRR